MASRRARARDRARTLVRALDEPAAPAAPPSARHCTTGKQPIATAALAEAARAKLARKVNARGGVGAIIRAYQCERCHGWHLTGTPDRADVRAIERSAPAILGPLVPDLL